MPENPRQNVLPADVAPPIPPAPATRRPRHANDIPPARQPFRTSWPVHYLGKMDIKCPSCGALHWKDERLTKSTINNPIFGMCCYSGKITLPQVQGAPPELDTLLRGTNDASKKFLENIRTYNNALAMTSLGVAVDETVNRGAGPYIFKIQGQLSHLAGSLLPQIPFAPKYAQLYIYDPADALNFRMNNPYNSRLDRGTMGTLQDMLYRRHPRVRLYRQAYELTANMPIDQQCTIALRFDTETDRRWYNLPTAAASNEVAVILPGDGDQRPENCRDIILRRRDQGLERITEMHPFYHALHYVLLFPTGQLGSPLAAIPVCQRNID